MRVDKDGPYYDRAKAAAHCIYKDNGQMPIGWLMWFMEEWEKAITRIKGDNI